jgi:hypothetical protein
MDFTSKTTDELLERRTAIVAELDAPEADLDALGDEMRAINAELEARKAAEAKKAEVRAAVAEGAGTTTQVFKKEERTTMDVKEIRSSNEYINAFANYVRLATTPSAARFFPTTQPAAPSRYLRLSKGS